MSDSEELKRINEEIRSTRAEMKAAGIKRSSMMNGGHSRESMRYNERIFALETQRQKLLARLAQPSPRPNANEPSTGE